MNLELFASPIKSENNFIKASFGGFAGSGKTRTATEFIIGCYKKLELTKPILIIDNEKGSRFLIPIFEKAGIKTLLKESVHLPDILQSFNFVNNGDIDFLFIDSLTKVWYKYIADYKQKNNNKKFMTLQDWGKILPAWQEDFADKFVALNGNCVFTGRGGNTYEMEENEETHKKEFVKSGVKMKMAGETPFEPDLNIWMEQQQEIVEDKITIWREALIMKDRSGLIDGKTFKNPTFENFKPVIDFLVNNPKGEVKKATNKENISPSDTASYEKKQQREIENEKIKNIFDKYAFGTSKEDKQLKVLISERIFKTSAGTEIERIKLEELICMRQELEEFFKGWEKAEDKKEYIKNYKTTLEQLG